jgi:hypothetical protein
LELALSKSLTSVVQLTWQNPFDYLTDRIRIRILIKKMLRIRKFYLKLLLQSMYKRP